VAALELLDLDLAAATPMAGAFGHTEEASRRFEEARRVLQAEVEAKP
jgi:hypothetical protein